MADPLDELRQGAQRIAGGDLSYRLAVKTGDEIQTVAEEFNRMGNSLQETDRKLRERDQEKTVKLEQVTRQLLEQEKLAAVGQLAAGVAHEVNNPAGIVSMFVQQLLERHDLPAVCKEKLKIMERHTERIGRITRGLLDFARGREYRREPVDLCRAIQVTVAALTPRLTKSHIKVEMRLDALENGFDVMGDEEQLQQVFENLVLNAVQAMGKQGTLSIVASTIHDAIQIRFSDTGPGVLPENIGRVFEPFFTTKSVGQGTGLGLAISFGIVKAHGGHMKVENAPEGGAIFTVVLPVESVNKISVMESV
jgi:C4-dicarboxylate-specific signal transduction histidine kinase